MLYPRGGARRQAAVSHLLLGLYDEAGLLHFIGCAHLKAVDGKNLAGMITDIIPGFTDKLPGQVMTQFAHRVGGWHPLQPALVAGVHTTTSPGTGLGMGRRL